MKFGVIFCLVALAAAPLFAQQPHTTDEPPAPPQPAVFNSEVELQFYNYGNFFQARGGAPEQSVNGFGAEYRGTYRPRPTWPDIQGSLNVLRYGGPDSQTSYGGRVGVSHYGSIHSYDVTLYRQENAYSFEVADATAVANMTMLTASYGYRLSKNWQAGVDSYLDWQRFDVDTGQESDYRSLGVQVRYRGFGNLIQPRVGFVTGSREVVDDEESYDESYWYVQVTSVPNPRVNVTLRYRDRSREYQHTTRVDDRDQWTLRGRFRQNERLAWTASYSTQAVDSSLPNNDYDTNVGFFGVIVGF